MRAVVLAASVAALIGLVGAVPATSADEATGSVSGVVSSRGHAARDIVVVVVSANDTGGHVVAQGTADVNGGNPFEIAGLGPGRYTLRLTTFTGRYGVSTKVRLKTGAITSVGELEFHRL